MQTEIAVCDEDSTLASVRRRSQGYLGYLFWVAVVLCLLWVANEVASLLQHWVALLYGVRSAVGFRAPVAGPDYFVLAGVAAIALLAIAGLAAAHSAYRAAWNRRLDSLWGERHKSIHARIWQLHERANEVELQRRTLYLRTLFDQVERKYKCDWPLEWRGHAVELSDNSPESYKNSAAVMLRSIEDDIKLRALAAGLVVGLNRSPLIDALSIAASAFELQLHVLTRLGKRPSARTWIEMLKRTSASLFINSYISRGDALYLNLLIRKAAFGLEMASDTVQEAAGAMDDIDFDEVIHGISVIGIKDLIHLVTMGMSVGASGLHHIGSFIESTANELLRGVLAGGILYYHGMELAAECLALDLEHRRSPEMTRTIGHAMNIACNSAGQLLRAQVRQMRKFLRDRRLMVFGAWKKIKWGRPFGSKTP